MRRGFWFVAGAGVGVYAVVKARRAAEALTPEGIRDRMAGLSVGAQLFAEEVRAGMVEREAELRDRFGYALDGPVRIELEAGQPDPRALPGDTSIQPVALPGTDALLPAHDLDDRTPASLEGTH